MTYQCLTVEPIEKEGLILEDEEDPKEKPGEEDDLDDDEDDLDDGKEDEKDDKEVNEDDLGYN